MDFHNENLATKEFAIRLAIEVAAQMRHEGRDDLGVVVQLKRQNAAISGGRVGDDVGEVAVQREEQAVQFLGLGNDERIDGADRQMVADEQDFMALSTEGEDDFQRDALVGEEPEFHAATMDSKSARSRAKSRQAEMSAGVRSGNCSRICSVERCAAR